MTRIVAILLLFSGCATTRESTIQVEAIATPEMKPNVRIQYSITAR